MCNSANIKTNTTDCVTVLISKLEQLNYNTVISKREHLTV